MFFLLWPQVLTPITETTFSNALVSFQMDDRFHLPARSTPTLTIAFTPSEAAPATFLEHPAHSHCQNCTQHNDISTSPSLLQRPHHRTLFLLAYSSKSFRSFCSPAWRSPRLTSLTSSHLHFFPTFTNTEHTDTQTWYHQHTSYVPLQLTAFISCSPTFQLSNHSFIFISSWCPGILNLLLFNQCWFVSPLLILV